MANDTTFLNSAKINKKDEFYTHYKDVENELRKYQDCFQDKVVYCNCDNPYLSNFYLYFKDNFHFLGLKELIASHINFEGSSYYVSYDGAKETKHQLEGNGDFRSPECIELLKQSDIVVTNPPFSLFREFVKTLVTFDKKFLIIGSINATKYQEIFPLIKDRKIWLGYGFHRMCAHFFSPYEDTANDLDYKNGMIRVSGLVWFTNLKNIIRPYYELTKSYNPIDYPKYDDYDAIEVSNANDIPMDYDGVMGVPITFLEKLEYDRFEIVDKINAPKINGKSIYTRILIKRKS